jgi:hypothetical protein
VRRSFSEKLQKKPKRSRSPRLAYFKLSTAGGHPAPPSLSSHSSLHNTNGLVNEILPRKENPTVASQAARDGRHDKRLPKLPRIRMHDASVTRLVLRVDGGEDLEEAAEKTIRN